MRPNILNPLFSSIENLKGVGTRYFKLITGLCGNRIIDVLRHLPSGLTDRTYDTALKYAQSGKLWTGKVRIIEHLPPPTHKQPYKIVADDGTAPIMLNFFKYYKDYFQKSLPTGCEKAISGKLEYFNGHLQMNHPDYIVNPEILPNLKGIEPIYPLCAGVSNKILLKIMKESLTKIPDMPEWLDSHFLKQENFSDFKTALKQVHSPKSMADLEPSSPARRRLAYDELLANQLTLAIARQRVKKQSGRTLKNNGELQQKLIKQLGFELTGAQQRIIQEITNEQAAPFQMLRLLQGDVGSGKTVVAFLTMLNAVACGCQAAIMAPTEILAKQHLDTMSAWANLIGISVELLSGRIKGKKRTEILANLAAGKIDILIGTHALFTEDVIFKDLAYIVVDEQHRFGVQQRLGLSAKGNKPDILVMTATPIPRTLVLTQYGDMEYSKLDEVPKGRKPVDTRIIPLSKITDVVSAIKRKTTTGSRVYWVCPLVEESEKIDLAAAEERFSSLQKIFGDKVGLIHGKMKEKEKDAVMERFKNGAINLLVATTVIEVGVNVPEATVMVVEQAERFGLAQLHQLRGRIKRGFEASTCILMYGYPLSQTARERLNIMKNSEDGFMIAEKDLELRGGGELLGTRQSGFNEFKLAILPEHKDLLLIAHQDAKLILQQDIYLSSARGQALRILLYLFEQEHALKTYLAG